MAERYISIDNVIGSGLNGKVMLSDLDLGQNDMARFSSLLTSYIKSGDFAADLTSPDWFSSGPSNYNIIPYMDSFENYIDKEILGPDTGITVVGTNLRAYNGYVSAQIDCSSAGAYKYLHGDTDTDAAWITVGTGTTLTTKYYFSGYFWFIGAGNGATLQIIKHNIGESESVVGSIIINSTDVDNAINRWTRFSSGPIILAEEDLITFKLIVNDSNTRFYMDALQLEIVVDGQEIQPFIQSGVVITDGSNIRVNSLAANAIKAYSITTSKISPEVGNELVISGNTSIVAQREVYNLIKYTDDPFATSFFEQGSINGSTHINEVSTDYIRTASLGIAITPNKDYVVRLSNSLIGNSKVFLYNNTTWIKTVNIALAEQFFDSGSANYARFVLGNGSSFSINDLDNYFAIMETASSYLSGTHYRFDGTGATIYNGDLTIKNNVGTNVFYADTNGNLQITGNLVAATGTFSGTVTALDGYIGDSTNGWNINSSTIQSKDGSITLDSLNKRIYSGNYATAGGFYLDSTGKFSIGNKLSFDGTNLAINGNISGSTMTTGKININGRFKVDTIGEYPYVEMTSSSGFLTMGNSQHPWISGINVSLNQGIAFQNHNLVGDTLSAGGVIGISSKTDGTLIATHPTKTDRAIMVGYSPSSGTLNLYSTDQLP